MPDNPAYVIVGATGGIGSDLCRRLAAGGAKLLLAARDPERLQTLEAELCDRGAECVSRPLDGRNAEEVDAAFAAAADRFGPLAGAVNLCGSILLKPAHLTTDAEFAETIAVNLPRRSTFFVRPPAP